MDWADLLPLPSCAVLTGFRGQGKSALGYYLLDGLAEAQGATAYVVGLPRERWGLLPDTIHAVETLGAVPRRAVVFLDEASLTMHAREWGDRSHVQMDKLMSLSRQRDQTLILATHHTRKLDVSLITDTGLLLCKKPSKLQSRLDRPEVRSFIMEAWEAFQKVPKDRDSREFTYCFNFLTDWAGLMENALPYFWSEDLSRAFGFDAEEGAQMEPQDPIRASRVRTARGLALREPRPEELERMRAALLATQMALPGATPETLRTTIEETYGLPGAWIQKVEEEAGSP